MAMVKSFDKCHHLFNLSILATILFLFMIDIQAYCISGYSNLTNKILPKKDIVRNNFMKYKHFPAPSFNHLIQPTPRIAKLKSLNGVLRGQLPPKIWFPTPPPSPQRICSSKSYKCDYYDKTKCKVSSYC